MPKAQKENPEFLLERMTALHVSALAEGKAKYKEADAALDALMKIAKPGQIIALPEEKTIRPSLRGKKFRVKDKFEKKNSIGVGLSARRYELEEVEEVS